MSVTSNENLTKTMSDKPKLSQAAEQEKKARDEFVRLLQNLKKIEQRLVVVETILKDADGKKKTSKEAIEAEEADNVCFIVPHIASDFKSIEGQSLPIPQLVKVFYSWSESLYTSAMLNRAHVKNKHLRTHMWASLEICQSLLAALQAHITTNSSTASSGSNSST